MSTTPPPASAVPADVVPGQALENAIRALLDDALRPLGVTTQQYTA